MWWIKQQERRSKSVIVNTLASEPNLFSPHHCLGTFWRGVPTLHATAVLKHPLHSADMPEVSTVEDPELDKEATEEALEGDAPDEAGAEEAEQADGKTTDDVPEAAASKKKKKSKKAKIKSALSLGKSEDGSKEGADGGSSSSSKPAEKLTSGMVEQLLEMNPSLKSEVQGLNKEDAASKIKKLDIADLLTGMTVNGKNQKDMASYKFWSTQPVARFDEVKQTAEGPIKTIDSDKVPKEPKALHEGFEWVTMDLEDDKEMAEVYELLYGHYVEDDEAMFRFNYSQAFLNWALKSPGWRADWHVGVRTANEARKLVAFISGVPQRLRVRANTIKSIEINFLCVHKKLRSKRLAPVLIQEITRRCYLQGIFQAIYTGGVVLPTPVSSCRYFHRSLDWLKLYEVGFSPLPKNSTKARQLTRFHLPSDTSTANLRVATKADVPPIHDLLKRYLDRFQMAPVLDEAEIEHLLIHDPESTASQVIWTYVVSDPANPHKITDFFSFYCLESSVIGNKTHTNIRAAYMFYYASETAFAEGEKALKERLNGLVNDALILAKRFRFDVFNALTLLDNPLFLEQQRFGAGDGQLHYYLYNYRTAPIAGGVNERNAVDAEKRGGVGVVMVSVGASVSLSHYTDVIAAVSPIGQLACTRSERGRWSWPYIWAAK